MNEVGMGVSSKSQLDVLVVGAGIAGLSTAWHLRESGLSVKILEASPHSFGHARSHLEFGTVWDEGPHVSFTKNSYVRDFISHGLPDIQEFRPKVACHFDGQWLDHPVQHNIDKFPQKLRMQVEADLRRENGSSAQRERSHNYGEWLLENFGKTMCECFFIPYTKKYWSADPQELSRDWVGQRISGPRRKSEGNQEKAANHYIDEIRYPRNGGFEQVYSALTQGVDVLHSRELVGINLESREATDALGGTWSFSTIVNTAPLPVFCSLLPDNQRPEMPGLEWTAIWLSNCLLSEKPKREETWGYVYDPAIPFARFWQPHALVPAPEGVYGIQTETYVRRAIQGVSDLPERSAPEVHAALERLQLSLASDLSKIGLVDAGDKISIAHHYVEWGNVLFTMNTKAALTKVWDKLSSFGLKRENDDLSPLSKWNDSGWPDEGIADVGTVIMAGRYAQWKYFWSDDCLLRGRAVAAAVRNSLQ